METHKIDEGGGEQGEAVGQDGEILRVGDIVRVQVNRCTCKTCQGGWVGIVEWIRDMSAGLVFPGLGVKERYDVKHLIKVGEIDKE